MSSNVTSTITPMTKNTPTMPVRRMGSVCIQESKRIIQIPPYDQPIIRVRIRPPAITEAIWPETFTLMEYMSRKF